MYVGLYRQESNKMVNRNIFFDLIEFGDDLIKNKYESHY